MMKPLKEDSRIWLDSATHKWAAPGQASVSLTLPFLLILPRLSGKPHASQPQLACQLYGVLGGRYS